MEKDECLAKLQNVTSGWLSLSHYHCVGVWEYLFETLLLWWCVRGEYQSAKSENVLTMHNIEKLLKENLKHSCVQNILHGVYPLRLSRRHFLSDS